MGRYRIAVLTSSRADFSIYLPLLKALRQHPLFDLHLVAFGSHTSPHHGYTLPALQAEGFEQLHCIDNLEAGDSARDLVLGQANTFRLFADFWQSQSFQLVFCLGDRFEMAAAVLAGLPFGLKFAHLHGGETSLGAIDNTYRHSISLASQLHFVSCQDHAERLRALLDDSRHVYVSGAPALDNLRDLQLYSQQEFLDKYGINTQHPTLLVTLHPETVQAARNAHFIEVFCRALAQFPQQLLITKANADTNGSIINKAMAEFAATRKNAYLVDSLGTKGYYSALQHCQLVIGNSSSGLIEAASFAKYVIDVGERQKGRKHGDNVLHCAFDEAQLVATIHHALSLGNYTGKNIFVSDSRRAADIIIEKTIAFLIENYQSSINTSFFN